MSNCKYAGTEQPRILPGRHGEECASGATGDDLSHAECPGCLPCPEPHCSVCRKAHAETCAECVAEARQNLHEIAELCGALPEEVKHRGIHSEAMMLLGPAADPEAWGHREASALAGRISADYLADARDEQHPLFVLGTWEMVWREHLEQPTDLQATLPRLVDYLDRMMHIMADEELVPFDEFARALRGCLSHLRAVLHDQAQGDFANIGCFDCGGMLERRLTKDGFEDVWTCRRCRRRYTYAEYNFALRANLEAARMEAS